MNRPGTQIGEGSPFRLTIPPDLAGVAEVRRWLGEIAQGAALASDRTFDMQVAVSEAVANGIEHAASAVDIEVWLLPDRLIVEVTNDGDFRPGRSVGEGLRRRGLGLPLIVSLADDVHAISEPGGRTRFTLTFLRGPRQAGQASGSSKIPVSVLRRLETERLKVSEATSRADLLADLLEHVTQPFGVGTPEGGIVMFNSAYAEFLGYTREEFAALDWARELTPPQWWDFEAEKLRELVERGKPVRYQKEHLHKDGTAVPVELLVEAIRDADGNPVYFYSFVTDLSDRARAEAALGESEERYRRLFENNPLLNITLRALRGESGEVLDWEYVDANQTALRILGVDLAELLTRRPGQFRTSADIANLPEYAVHAGWVRTLETGEPFAWERTFRGFHYDLRVFRLDPDSIVVAGMDITERRRAELERSRMAGELAGERSLLGAIVEVTPAALALLRGSDLVYLVVNPAYQAFGPDRQMAGRSVLEVWSEIAAELEPIFRGVLETGEPYNATDQAFMLRSTSDGPLELRSFSWSLLRVPLPGEQGWGLLNTAVETTEHTRREAALQETRERYRIVADFTRDWEHWRDQEGRFVYVSPSAERVTGYPRDEFLIHPDLYLRIVHPDDRERVSRHLAESDIADSLMFRIIRRDGEERWIEHACEPVTDSAGCTLGRRGSNRDITERLRTQARLQLEEQKAAAGYARSLIEASLDPLVTISPEGKITDVNEATVEITGRSRGELIGTDFSDYFTDPESARRGYQEVFARGSVTDYPLTLRDREGNLTDVLYNASVYTDPQGNVQGVFAAARDVSVLKELEIQRRIAGTLQQTLLDLPPAIPGVTYGHLYRSATAEAAVGGDFFDIFEAKKGRVGLLIGDVAGHGVEAARMSTLVKDTIRAFAHQFRRPSVILRETNQLLLERRIPGFVTIFLGMLDRGTGLLVYSLAGHPYPLRRRAGGEVEELTGAAVPLGVFPDQSWKEYRVQLDPSDALLLYTDGASEVRRDGRFFGEAGLTETLRRHGGGSPEALPALVLDEVLRFSGGILSDDVALLAVGLRPAGQPDGSPDRSPEGR